MKKIFIPSMDELYQMQDMGANIYKYMLVKVIEKLVIAGINHPDKGILKNAYKYFKEDQYIAPAICSMYPEEIKYSEIASMDINLCIKLLEKQQEIKCKLDYLAMFDSLVLSNSYILEKTIQELKDELKNNPKYRFEYQNNELLKRIFNRRITEDDIMSKRYLIDDLLEIEPAYGVSLSSRYFENDKYDRANRLRRAINSYACNYGIPWFTGTEYINQDILTNQSTEVKRLIRCINSK